MAQFESVSLSFIFEPEEWFGLYDVLEIWRSTSGPNGPYEELTAENWAPAKIPRAATEPPASPVGGAFVNVVGLNLILRRQEGADVTIIFSGSDPLTLSQAAQQIVVQGQGLFFSYVDINGRLTLRSSAPGNAAVMRIVGGEAAPILGLPTVEPESFAFGKEPRLQLSTETQQYTFLDRFGIRSAYYRPRFRNRLTGAVSAFGDSSPIPAGAGVSATSKITGTLDLVQGDGRPMGNREVLVEGYLNGLVVDGRSVGDIRLSRKTNADGHVEFELIRGIAVTVAVVETNLVKKVNVPSDPAVQSFKLLDPSVGTEDDYFGVRVVTIPFAARRAI